MKNNWHGIREEFSEEGGGGSGGGEGQQQQTQAPVIDYDKLSQSIAGAIPQPQQQVIQAPRSNEDIEREYKQRTKYPEYGVEQLKPLLGENVTPEQAAHFQKAIIEPLLQHVFATNGLMLNFSLGDLKKEYDGQMAPLRTDYQERQFEKGVKEITTKFPGLKGQESTVKTVANAIQSQGLDLSKMTRDQRMEFVANEAGKLLKNANPNFSLQQASNQNAGGAPFGALNGNSGGSSGGGGQKQKNPWDGLF